MCTRRRVRDPGSIPCASVSRVCPEEEGGVCLGPQPAHIGKTEIRLFCCLLAN